MDDKEQQKKKMDSNLNHVLSMNPLIHLHQLLAKKKLILVKRKNGKNPVRKKKKEKWKMNFLHVISSKLDWDAETIFPLNCLIIELGAIKWSGGAGSGGVVGGGYIWNPDIHEKRILIFLFNEN